MSFTGSQRALSALWIYCIFYKNLQLFDVKKVQFLKEHLVEYVVKLGIKAPKLQNYKTT